MSRRLFRQFLSILIKTNHVHDASETFDKSYSLDFNIYYSKPAVTRKFDGDISENVFFDYFNI